MSRQFFTPSSDETSSKAEGGEAAKDGETPLPDLPDVPTKEPTEEGQPEPKRAKVNDADK